MRRPLLLLSACLFCVACDKAQTSDPATAQTPDDPATPAKTGDATPKTEDAPKADKPASGSPLDTDVVRAKENCSKILTASVIKDVLGVEYDPKKVKTFMKGYCSYHHDKELRANMVIQRASKTVEKSPRFFENVTKDSTPEDQKKALEAVGKQFDKEMAKKVANKELTAKDAKLQKKTGKKLLGSMGVNKIQVTTTFTLVPGIGDRAKLSKQVAKHNGKEDISYSLHVLHRNIYVVYSIDHPKGVEVQQEAMKKLAKATLPLIDKL